MKLGGLLGGISDMVLSPDGKRVAFIGAVENPVRSYAEPDLWTLELTPGATAKNLTANYDYDVNSGLLGDMEPPRAAGRLDAGVVERRIAPARRGRQRGPRHSGPHRRQLAGRSRSFRTAIRRSIQFTTSDDGKVVVMNVSTPTMIDELFVLQPGRQRSGRLPI